MARSGDFGITTALWLSGDVRIAYPGFDVEKNTGFLLRVFYDAYIMEKFGVGAYVSFSPISWGSSDLGATMYEFGCSLKPRFPLGDGDVVIKPGLNIGYRTISSDFADADGINALGLNVSVEIQYNIKNVFVPYLEIGFLAQPAGGNDNSDITFPPIIYFGAGVAF
jgi:hypothetical protein